MTYTITIDGVQFEVTGTDLDGDFNIHKVTLVGSRQDIWCVLSDRVQTALYEKACEMMEEEFAV